MKIVDYGYIIPTVVIIIGFPLLFYLKLSQHKTKPLDITIYGSTVETALLAYYIDKNLQKVYGQQDKNKKYLNISLVSPFDPPQNDKMRRETDKNLLTFCGVQDHLLKMLNDLDLQFEINQYGIYFSHLKQRANMQNDMQTYKIQQAYPIKSFFQYGLSHITAKNIFQSFQNHLNINSKSRVYESIQKSNIDELSMSSSISHLFPYQFIESGIQYLSQIIGLDQQYIHDYIMPVIWGNYLHQANSITSMFKLLPLFCTKNKEIGSSLAILIDQNQLYQKLIQKLKYVNINHIYNHHLQQFKIISQSQQAAFNSQVEESINQQKKRQNQQSQNQLYEIEVTYLNTFVNQTKQQEQKQIIDEKEDGLTYKSLNTNLLFIIQDYQMVNKKQISYYKTIVDGKITSDQNYQQYFTLYFTYEKENTDGTQQNNKNGKYIYSATRLCKQNCKNFNKNVYLLISKQRLTEKDLVMFQEHHIVYYKKFWLPKTQLPSEDRFEQTENVYRIYDTQSISDSYEFKLTVFDQLSHIVLNKMQN